MAPTLDLPLPFYRGRVGLYHLLRTLGVGRGDEVMLQAFTCLAVPEAILATGATPVWADLEPDSVNLCSHNVRAKLTGRTKAIIAQHTFGIPADMGPLLALAAESGVPVIEDCCHSIASTVGGRPVGSLGLGAFWSYEWGKPVIAGVGGGARFNDTALQARLSTAQAATEHPPARRNAILEAQYVAFARLYSPHTFWWVRRAFRLLGRLRLAESNYNPVGLETAADFRWRMAPGAAQRLPAAIAAAAAFEPERRAQAEFYRSALANGSCRLPPVPAGTEAVYSRFPLFVANKEEVLAAAARRNLEVAGWFATPVHPLAGDELAAVHYRPGDCPQAERAATGILSLPVHPKVTRSFQRAVVELINRHGRA
ncbi:DegT/DnrJ/EryC1/StrS family aminotransferase [Oleiharenicola sp. Vm1]|uniref:DegT/DnrJ/EryC1/StrS family aminotransferase n=1 Tax=Oleiharenicola sp. Vm1 TaxID=3398393 RepID=UPI0039F60A3B